MIRLYSGTPGSGKSLHNARDVINRSRTGKPVIGNFPCDLSRYKKAQYTYVPNYELTPDFLIRYSREYFAGKKIKEGSLLLVIDECQLMFNSRDWQQKGRNEWLAFFTQHRKFGYDVTLIAQFDRMIDRQIRGVIEYEYVHRKLSNYGIGGRLFSLLLGGNTFVVVQMWYPLKLKIGSEFVHAHKRLYSIYDTFGTFDTEAPSAKETQPQAQTAEKPSEGDMQHLQEELISDAAQAKKPEKRRIFKKLSFPRRYPREKKAKQKKVKYLAHFRNPYALPFWAKLRHLFYRGKFRRRYPENRNEFGWRKYNV